MVRPIRRVAAALLLAGALCGLAAGAAPAHTKLISSTLVLSFQGSDYGDTMSGSLASPNQRCVAGRAVTRSRTRTVEVGR